MSSNGESGTAGDAGGDDVVELEERELVQGNSDPDENPGSACRKSGRREHGEVGSAVKERILRSDVAKHRDGEAETASRRNTVTNVGVEFAGRRVLRSDVAKRRKDDSDCLTENVSVRRSDTSGLGDRSNGEILEMSNGSVAQERESNGPKVVKENATGSGHQKVGKVKRKIYVGVKGEKRTTRYCNAIQKEETDANKKKVKVNSGDQPEPMKCEEESQVKKRTTRLDIIKQKEKAKIVPEVVSESEMSRKRNQEASASEPSRKKLKVEFLRFSQHQEKKRDNFQEISGSNGKNVKLAKCSYHRTVGRLKGNGIAPNKSYKVVGRGAAKVLSRNKKAVGFENSNIQKEIEENRENSQAQNHNKYCSPSLHKGKRNLKRSSSKVLFGESHLSRGKTYSVEKITHGAKNRLKLDLVDTSNVENEAAVKDEMPFTSEVAISTREIQETEVLERRAAKKKLRHQIKDILLNAGWTIDLRPRKGRSYDDSVYISPQGLTYWSITGAYSAFQTQMNCSCGEKDKLFSSMPLEKSKMSGQSIECTSSALSLIPIEALSILKKVMLNKRRSKAELEETKKNLMGGKQHKMAKLGSIKQPKNKPLKHRGRKVMERTKKTNVVASNNKSIVGYISKKAHGRNREKQRGMVLLPRGSKKEMKIGTGDYVPYFGKRTIFSWMIDLGIMPSSGKLKYMNQNKTRPMLEGWITRNGIHCSCCSRILTVATFENHAGSKLCQPYRNIFLEDAGISLLQCQLNAWEKQDESVRQSFYSINTDGDDPNDDTCGICGDGGDLICCDSCPSTFHLSCLGIEMLPPGDWNCMNCSCRFCCIVSSSGSQEYGAAVSPLCSCYHCGKKYHLNCVPDRDAIPVSSNFPCISYCGQSCKKLFEQLQRLLGVKNDLEAGFSWTLLQRLGEDLPESVCAVDQRVECNSKIAVALAVMDECFVPIIDQRSGINLIHNVVYNCGSNFSRLNYCGFYTIVLEREDEIISAASIRIHGTELAEMPFIGTRNIYRRQGMCRRLLNGIESALCSLDVSKLIIPAISELMETWTNIFGFKPLDYSEKQEVRSINMLVFPGTGLLAKQLLKRDSAEHSKTADQDVPDESSVCSIRGLSDKITVQHGYEINDKNPWASEVLPESSDTSRGCKSSETLMSPEVVYYDQVVLDKKFQLDSSSKAESKFSSEDNLHDNSVVKAKDTSVVPDLLLDVSSESHDFTKCISPDAIAANLHYSDAKAVTDLPAVSGTSMPLDAIACTLQESSGNDPYTPGCSLGLSSHGTRCDESKMTRNSSVVILVEHDPKISTEHIVVNNHKILHEVHAESSFSDHIRNGNSELFVGPLVADTKSLTSIEPTIDSIDNGKLHSVQKLKIQPSPARLEPFADNGCAEQGCPEVIKLEIVPGKQSQNECMTSASCNTDIISLHTCSVQSMFIQCTSELQQKPREEFCIASLPFATDELHCNKCDSDNIMSENFQSINTVSLGEGNMCNHHEATNDASYVENHLSDLDKNSVIFSKDTLHTMDANFESNSSDDCYAITSGGSNHEKHMMTKGLYNLYPDGSNSSASTYGAGNQSPRFENSPVAGSDCATAKASNVNADENIDDLKVVPE